MSASPGSRRRWCSGATARACWAVLLLGGCQGRVSDPGGGQTTPEGALCGGTPVTAKKRIVRLTFNQVTNSISALLGATIGQQIATDFEVVDASHRTFPPLQNPREGAVVTDNAWDIGDRMAQEAAKYVLDNFAAVTGCATATDACAQQFLKDLAQKSFRRPL